MSRFVPYILKTLWRHRSRTLLTVAGSAVALFVFCCVAAVQEGMRDLQRRQVSQRSLIAFQANKFCPATSHLPQDYVDQIESLEGVRAAVPIQVFTNNCRASLDVVVFYGLPPGQLRDVRQFQLQTGSWTEFEQHQDSAVIGRSVASRREIGVGQRFTIGELSVEVAGIYSAQDPAEENYIYTHLEFLQRGQKRNMVGTVTQIEVQLEEGVDAMAKCQEIDTVFRSGQVETDTRPKGAFQAKSLGDLIQLISLSRVLGFACVGLVLALVATTTLMSVQDRVREHGVLQTLGLSWRSIFLLVLIESLALSLLGGVLGTVAAMLVLQYSSLALGAEAVTIAFSASYRLVAWGLGVAAVTGVLAGLLPAWHASRAEIVPSLRHGSA